MEQSIGAGAALAPVDPVHAVDAVLRDYAGRGVFSDYRMMARKGNRDGAEYHFGWLYGQPFTLVCEPKQARLSLPDLLPNIVRDSMLHKEVKAFLKGRAAADVPEHRRVDPARATAAARLREGTVSLELTLCAATNTDELQEDYAYGTRKLVNLAHELFLFMNEYWADYMWEHFQLNME